MQRELLSVTGPMNKLPNEGAACAACTELAEQLALLDLLSLAQLQSSSTPRHPVTQPPSLGHLSFHVPHLFGGQSFAVQAEGKPPIPRNGFSLEIRDVTHASRPPQELTLCRKVPSHCVAQPIAGDGQGSGLVRQEWRLGVTPAFLLQLGLFSVWAPCAVQRRLSDSSERWVGLCRHGSVAQGCCPSNPNVSEAAPGRAFVMFLFLAFTLVSVVLEKHRKP